MSKEIAAFVCSHVFENRNPVLLVSRADGDWQLLCGGSHEEGEVPRIVGLEHLVSEDPRLHLVLDLPMQWEAERSSPASPWERRPIVGRKAMSERVKLRFPFTNSAGESEVETMWTLRRDDGYEVDNIPFYVKELALGDVVSARAAAEGLLWFSELVRPSGHSTIRLWFSNEQDVQPIRDELKRMGCASEVSELPRLVAVDIPPSVTYEKVKAWLDQGEQAGTFAYQEACLGFP